LPKVIPTPPIITLVVHTGEGQRELLLHDDMEIIRKEGRTYIVDSNGNMTLVPEFHKAYTTHGKIFPGKDGQLSMLCTTEGIDCHPDDPERFAAITRLVNLKHYEFLDMEFFEVHRI
jgi:hypothetical protein